ncbi:unnamed protein product [Zymoseptoria tritici ST99CH_1E4]|uniref:MULE transposase domain-containing protein n=1 Tax=Zymoseptoria tritici ST99CH_1E4 TaxID=1276532 RepID=A0A2H1H9N7_ZYMTR|nr:unnamed protein product [Zymoseptoria tritici ST99CH_1E4]
MASPSHADDDRWLDDLLNSQLTDPPPQPPSPPPPPSYDDQSDSDNNLAPTRASFERIPPHEKRTFDSLQELEAYVYAFALEQGFDVKVSSSKKKNGVAYKRFWNCARYCPPERRRVIGSKKKAIAAVVTGSHSSRRNRRTKKDGCQYSLVGSAVDRDDPSTSQWTLDHGNNPVHSHGRVERATLANARRRERSDELVKYITDARSRGLSTRLIKSMLKRDFHGLEQTAHDIANAVFKARAVDLDGMSVVERSLEILRAKGFWCDHDTKDGRLDWLFFAHPDMIKQHGHAPEVVLADCTYKTIEYGLPLLQFSSMNGFNQSKPLAMMLMPGEEQADYEIALRCFERMLKEHNIDEPRLFLHDRDKALINALDAVFPEMPTALCRWHLRKAVEANAKCYLKTTHNPATGRYELSDAAKEFMEAFDKAINAPTEALFDDAKRGLWSRAGEDQDWFTMVTYLEDHWWIYKERCVKAWTDKIRHYGNETTSPVEGAHAGLKA